MVKANEMKAPAKDKRFQDKDYELLNSAIWYIEGLDKRLLRHKVRLVIEPNLSFDAHVEAR